MRTTMLIAGLLVTVAGLPAFAGSLSCHATAGGAAFDVTDITDVPAAAVKAAGAEKCDKVYHIEGQGYELGGCNRKYVGLWSPRQGSPLGYKHGRLPLICQ